MPDQPAADLNAAAAPDRAKLIAALHQNWRAEVEGAQIYRDLAAQETDARRRQVLERLAEAEQRHAEKWAAKLAALGSGPPVWHQTLRHRWNRALARVLGIDTTLRRMETREQRDIARYGDQVATAMAGDADARAIAAEIRREERMHAKMIGNLAPVIGPKNALAVLLRRERWHGRGGTWIADAIYGVNDGLGAVFGIVSGVAGATADSHFILISGLAGMLASALSMGSGAFLAVQSQREVYEAEMHREQKEIAEDPEEEKEEMALFYQLQGFSEAEARRMVEKLAQDPDQMLKTHAQAELGLSEHNFPNPLVSAVSAAVSTGVGAFIPIIPFFFMRGIPALVAAAVVSLAAHFAVGAAKSLVTVRSWWASGLEMTVVGAIEAAVTYGLGRAFGAAA